MELLYSIHQQQLKKRALLLLKIGGDGMPLSCVLCLLIDPASSNSRNGIVTS